MPKYLREIIAKALESTVYNGLAVDHENYKKEIEKYQAQLSDTNPHKMDEIPSEESAEKLYQNARNEYESLISEFFNDPKYGGIDKEKAEEAKAKLTESFKDIDINSFRTFYIAALSMEKVCTEKDIMVNKTRKLHTERGITELIADKEMDKAMGKDDKDAEIKPER